MSLSNPTLTNPAQHFFQWSGSLGQLTWYDKENKKNVQVKLPFSFIVLDQLATITGYSKSDESGFWSNEVRNIKKDELFVRTKKGPFEAGYYDNLTQTMKRGGKYAKSIYIAHKIGEEWVIGNIKAHGSALSAWIEFTKIHNAEKGKISMAKGEAQDAPTGRFYPPAFTFEKWSDEEYQTAVKLDRELQIYLSQYLSTPKVDDDGYSMGEPTDTPGATKEQLQDFEQRREKGLQPAKRAEPVLNDPFVDEEISDEPINLDDIPF